MEEGLTDRQLQEIIGLTVTPKMTFFLLGARLFARISGFWYEMGESDGE